MQRLLVIRSSNIVRAPQAPYDSIQPSILQNDIHRDICAWVAWAERHRLSTHVALNYVHTECFCALPGGALELTLQS